MARSGLILAGLWSAFLTMAGCTVPEASAEDSSLVVQRATITLVPDSCAGVIVGDDRHAITSAHCIRAEAGGPQAIALYDGTHIDGTLTVVDRAQDIALIKLKDPAPVEPLALADHLPKPGDEATFTSRMDQPGVPQQIQIQKLGRCPSLPEVPSALFTSLRGKPGDSGSPVVNPQLQVVGLVHGGARCSIAAPTADFAEELQAHLEADRMEEQGHGG